MNIPRGGSSTITVDLLHDNTGASVSDVVPYTGEVSFTTTSGNITNSNITNGIATTTLNAGTVSGTATVTATLDDMTVTKLVTVT